MIENFSEKADFIWSIADLLRGDYNESEYQKVVLPLTILRRLDCVAAQNKDEELTVVSFLIQRHASIAVL